MIMRHIAPPTEAFDRLTHLFRRGPEYTAVVTDGSSTLYLPIRSLQASVVERSARPSDVVARSGHMTDHYVISLAANPHLLPLANNQYMADLWQTIQWPFIGPVPDLISLSQQGGRWYAQVAGEGKALRVVERPLAREIMSYARNRGLIADILTGERYLFQALNGLATFVDEYERENIRAAVDVLPIREKAGVYHHVA
jgi:hypothetical protein